MDHICFYIHLGDYVWWLWVTRLPEFVLGMILYQYKEVLIQKKIIYSCLAIGLAGFIVNYQFNQDTHILWRIISLNPLSFLVLCLVYIFIYFSAYTISKLFRYWTY